jgi:ethanolamine ammonia-lyase small subunit
MKLTTLNLAGAAEFANALDHTRAIAGDDAVVAQVKENLLPALFTLAGGNDPEDAKYRRITAPQMRRDLNPLMQERMQAVCYYLSVTNPFAKRIVEVIVSYVFGEGIKVVCTDPKAQEVVDKCWNDPVNALGDPDRGVRSWGKELSVFGEVVIPVVENPTNGAVRFGYVDPLDIAAIEYGALMPDDTMGFLAIPVAVLLKKRVGESASKRLAIIRQDEDPNSESFGQLVGDCFYSAVNKAKGGTRGFSDLFALADWADVFDAMIFDVADRNRFLNAFVWDLEVSGADEEAVNKWKKYITQSPPKQGGAFVHNEQVKLSAQTPDLKGADNSEISKMVRNYGLGGAGLPTWFFADGSDTNRSTADEMTGPTGKKLTDRQNEVKSMISTVVTYVLDRAIARGVLAQTVDRSFKLQVPDLMIKDLSKAAATLGALTNSISIAEENGWIRGETAARCFHVLLGQIGVDVDTDDEYKKAQQEARDRQAKQVDALAPQKMLASTLTQLEQARAGAAAPGAPPKASVQ